MRFLGDKLRCVVRFSHFKVIFSYFVLDNPSVMCASIARVYICMFSNVTNVLLNIRIVVMKCNLPHGTRLSVDLAK